MKECSWEQWEGGRGQPFPQGRKAHSAVVYKDSMYVYGGYQDMRGSLSELWQYSFGNKKQHTHTHTQQSISSTTSSS